MKTQLQKNLLHIGRRVNSPRGIGGLRWGLLLIAVLVLTWTVLSIFLAHAVYEHRSDITRERTPQPAASGEILWGAGSSSIEQQHVALIAIDQATDKTDSKLPLPPGVEQWPKRGQAIVSPALRNLLAEIDQDDYYGEVIGEVAESSLAAPSELIAYVRPPRPLTADNSERVTSFGVKTNTAGDEFTGEVLYDRDEKEFWALAVLLLGIPGGVALVSSTRVASTATRRRHVLLTRIGATKLQRAMIALPPIISAAATAAAISIGLLAVFAESSRRIPFTDFILDASIVRENLLTLLGSAVLVPLIAMVTTAWMTAGRLGDYGAGRLSTPQDRTSYKRSISLLAVIAAQPWIIIRLAEVPIAVISATVLGATAVILLLPGAISDGIRLFADWKAPRDLASGEAGTFVAWRLTSARPRALARLAGTLMGLIIIVAHAAVILTMFLGPSTEILQASQNIGGAVAEVRLDQYDEGASARAALDLAEENDLKAIRINQYMSENRLEMIAECGHFEALEIECISGEISRASGPPWLGLIIDWYWGETAETVVDNPADFEGNPESMSRSVMLLSRTDGGDVDINQLSRDAYIESATPLSVERIAGSEIRAANDLVGKASWIYVFGLPGVIALLFVSALTWAAVTMEETRDLITNPVLADQKQIINAVSSIRVAMPIALGGIVGVLASVWLLWPQTAAQQMSLPYEYLTVVLIGTALASTAAGIAGQRIMNRGGKDL